MGWKKVYVSNIPVPQMHSNDSFAPERLNNEILKLPMELSENDSSDEKTSDDGDENFYIYSENKFW